MRGLIGAAAHAEPMAPSLPPAEPNPFATRFIRPTAAKYLFATGCSAAGLVEKLRTNGWWGQICGPHGAGKSTLLGALLAEIEAAGRRNVRFSLHDRQRTLPAAPAGEPPWDERTQVVVDGYEQLSWWSRLRLKARCRTAGAGLLVTAHTSVGLPAILEVVPTLETAQRVVQRLLPVGDETIGPEDVAQAFAAQGGNMREMLFQLYDVYQQRRQ